LKAHGTRFRPTINVRVEPGDRVLAELPSLGEFAGALEAIDGHPREAGKLHYMSNAKELHIDISCDVPFRGGRTPDARTNH
jgi:hypothetical protein